MEWEPDPNCEVQVIWINHPTSYCQWIHSLLAFIFLKIWSSFPNSHCLWIYFFFFFFILSSYKEGGVKPVNLAPFIPFREVAGEDMPTPKGTETKGSWRGLVIFDRRKRLTWEIPLTGSLWLPIVFSNQVTGTEAWLQRDAVQPLQLSLNASCYLRNAMDLARGLIFSGSEAHIWHR